MLTPERRAELRELAESAQPFIRHGGTDPAAAYVPAAELAALLDAADERDRLADALVRAQGPFACCSHCERDAIHDIETNAHEVPCTLCQVSIGEVERLRSEHDQLAAAVERVRALHRTVGIFDECDCDDDAKAEGHLDIYEVGTTCNKLYDICDECCRNGGYQTEECADYHRHGLPDEAYLCATIRALDGTDEKEESWASGES